MPMSADDYLASLAIGTNNASVSLNDDRQTDDPKKKVNGPVVKPIDADAYLASVASGTPYGSNETPDEHKKRMQPILDRNAEVTRQEQAHSGLGEQFGKSLLQGAGGAVSSALGTFDSLTGHNLPIGPDAHSINLGIKSLKNHLDNVLSDNIPTVDPKRPLASIIAQGSGGTIGDAGIQALAFKGAGALVGGAATALEDVPLAQKSISAISKIADMVGNWAERKAPNILGKGVGGIVDNYLPNVAKAGIVQGSIDPQSLSTPGGIGKTAAMGLVGAAGDAGYGLKGYKDPNAIPNPVDAIQYSKEVNKALDDPSGIASGEGKGKDGNPLPSYSQKIQSQLGVRASNVPGIPTLTDLLGKVADLPSKFRSRILTKNEYVRNAESNGDLSTTPNYAVPSNIAELNAGISGRIDKTFHDGPFTFDGSKLVPSGTPGLAQILANVPPEQLGTLDRILTAGHAISKDDGTGELTNERQELRNAPPELIQISQQIMNYNRQVMNYATSQGAMTPKMGEWIDNIYASGLKLNDIFTKSEAGSRVLNMARELQGDLGQKKHSPIANTIDFTKRIIAGTDRNKVWSALAEQADSDPVGFNEIMRPASDGHYATEFNSQLLFEWANKLQNAVKPDGNKPVTPSSIMEGMSKQDALALVQLLHPNYEEGSGVITVTRPDGPVRYQINPELAKYAKSLSPEEIGPVQQLFRTSASIAKAGITKEPLFMLFHGLIDNITAATQSQHGYTFGVDYAKGLFEGIIKGESYREWQAAGGSGGTFGDFESLTDPYGVNSVIPKTTGQKIVTNVLHPLDALSELTKPIYTAAKLGEYMNIRKNFPDIDVQSAALASRRVTPDMMQMGGSMKALSGIAEFSNPAIQHIDNFYQSLKANPKGMFAKGAIGITMPTVALWFANRNDEAINELRKAPGGDRYWYVRMHGSDDGIIKLKKPYLLGYTFGTLAEQGLDKMLTDDPNTIDQAHQAFADAFKVNMIPQIAQTAYGLMSNKDFSNNAPIVPSVEEGIDPQFQTTNNTSQLAKTVSNKVYNLSGGSVNLSPIQLDFVLNHQFGTLGEDAGKASNSLVKSENSGPSKGIDGMPIIGKLFANYPSRNLESIHTFYDNYDAVNSVNKTLKSLAETGNPHLDEYIQDHISTIALAPIMTEARAQMSKINGQLYKINSLPDALLSPDEKKSLNDQYLKEIQMISQAVNQGIKTSDLRKRGH